MTRSIVASMAVCLLLASAAFGQVITESGPRDAATQPADSSDQAAAKAAAKAFMLALTADDVADAKKLFGGTDEDFKTVEMMHDTIKAAKAFRAAAEKQWPGFEAGKHMSNDLDPKVMAERIDREQVKIDGDTAMFSQGSTLKKINGEWKVVDMIGDPNGKKMVSRIMPAITQAANDTTPEIGQGKYASFDEANKAMQTRMRAAMQAVMSDMMGGGMRATTRPAP